MRGLELIILSQGQLEVLTQTASDGADKQKNRQTKHGNIAKRANSVKSGAMISVGQTLINKDILAAYHFDRTTYNFLKKLMSTLDIIFHGPVKASIT